MVDVCSIVCRDNDAAADAGDAVACDERCDSGCNIQGAGKCDSVCATGYLLNTIDYTCVGLSHSPFFGWKDSQGLGH